MPTTMNGWMRFTDGRFSLMSWGWPQHLDFLSVRYLLHHTASGFVITCKNAHVVCSAIRASHKKPTLSSWVSFGPCLMALSCFLVTTHTTCLYSICWWQLAEFMLVHVLCGTKGVWVMYDSRICMHFNELGLPCEMHSLCATQQMQVWHALHGLCNSVCLDLGPSSAGFYCPGMCRLFEQASCHCAGT